jgi:hypothetical protein
MKKLFVAFIASCLFAILITGPISAQTKEDGIALYNEALELHEQAQMTEDVKKVVERYEAASQAYYKT